ncbi:MAG: hypothetical protein ACXWW5_06995 [Actinomycetota bacterium]
MTDTKREPFGRLVGAILITEGVLVAILRFLAVVYVVASEAYSAERFRTPLPNFLPWVTSTVVVTFVLVWAGSFFRRSPGGAWAEVGLDARVDLIAAFLLNATALVWAVSGLAGSPSTVEASLTWIALGVASLVVVVGLVRDALRRRPAD